MTPTDFTSPPGPAPDRLPTLAQESTSFQHLSPGLTQALFLTWLMTMALNPPLPWKTTLTSTSLTSTVRKTMSDSLRAISSRPCTGSCSSWVPWATVWSSWSTGTAQE
uniref:C-C motif chemokine receptor 9 n=1 Tax=Rhinopithecus bieti TaxID=61621 RepID=A0A2K6MLC7_RHIBE